MIHEVCRPRFGCVTELLVLHAPLPWDGGWPNPIRYASFRITSTDRKPEPCAGRISEQHPSSESFLTWTCIELLCEEVIWFHLYLFRRSQSISLFRRLLNRYCAVLCCALLYCTVQFLCCAVLYCAAPYCAVFALLSFAVLYCNVLCCAVLFCAVLCCAVLLCCTMLCYAMLCHAMPCHADLLLVCMSVRVNTFWMAAPISAHLTFLSKHLSPSQRCAL
jgi:hypothetical protein